MCFNVFIICNHEKGTSIEIGSSEGGGGGGEGLWSGDGGERARVGGGGRVCMFVCVCFIVSPLTVFL